MVHGRSWDTALRRTVRAWYPLTTTTGEVPNDRSRIRRTAGRPTAIIRVMARTKAFDPDTALEAAMELFWQKGFEASSMQDLVDVMGISRASLYDTFGDKNALYLRALEHYGRQVISEKLTALEAGPPLAALRRFFKDASEAACCTEGWRGCLLTNALVERAPHCKDASRVLGSLRQRLEAGFHRVLVRAQKAGELSSDKRPRALARYLVGLLQGLTVTARSRPEPRMVRDLLEVGLSVLD